MRHNESIQEICQSLWPPDQKHLHAEDGHRIPNYHEFHENSGLCDELVVTQGHRHDSDDQEEHMEYLDHEAEEKEKIPAFCSDDLYWSRRTFVPTEFRGSQPKGILSDINVTAD